MVPPYLKTMRTLEALLAVMLLSTCSLSGCTFLETPDGSTEVTAIFSLTPSSNVQVGQEVEVDASSSLPSDGSLTYRWDFDGDGQSDESGVSATWTYLEAEEVTIELTVSDGTNRDTRSVDLTIFEASVSPPTADAGSGGSEADCDEESIDSTTYYLVYLCEMDQSSSDRNVDGTVDVELDGSGSTSRNTGGYVAQWAWDLDLQTDTDGDGDTENDADLTGERPTWQGVPPGEYDIALNVEDENGMTAKDEVTVFVNYVGLWSDMDIGPNRTSGAPTIEFTFPVAYDRDSGNTIRRRRSSSHILSRMTIGSLDPIQSRIGTGWTSTPRTRMATMSETRLTTGLMIGMRVIVMMMRMIACCCSSPPSCSPTLNTVTANGPSR